VKWTPFADLLNMIIKRDVTDKIQGITKLQPTMPRVKRRGG